MEMKDIFGCVGVRPEEYAEIQRKTPMHGLINHFSMASSLSQQSHLCLNTMLHKNYRGFIR